MREIDYRSLRFLVERSDGSRLERDRELRKLEKAYRYAKSKKRLVLPKDEPIQHRWYRCEARFWFGDYTDWDGWQFRDDWAQGAWYTNPYKTPVWRGGWVDRLYVVGEQGLGDEVLFAQALWDVKPQVGEVVVETQPRLMRTFERAFGVKAVSADLIPHPSGEGELRIKKEPEGDEWVTLGELVRVFRKGGFPRKPYLTAAPKEVERFKSYRGRVGISWRGRQGAEERIVKAYPGALSLQYGQRWDEEVEKPPLDLKDDLEGILGLLANLEKLVTVSTSVAHFASAMGVPTEVIIAPKWTTQHQNIVPWKWHAENLPNQTWWYPPTTKTYDSWGDYLRHQPKSFGAGL